MKKTRINIKLPQGDKVIVSRGDRIDIGDVLTRGTLGEIDEFNLAKLFHVSPKKALSYLTVKEGILVEKGALLARKPGLLSKELVKSPTEGVFRIENPEKGIVGITKIAQSEPVVAWFSGVVVEVTDEKLTFDVEGHTIAAKEGKGLPVSGRLTVVDGQTILDIPVDVEDKVVVVKNAYSSLVAKVDALGALAVIAEELEEPPFTIPYLLFDSIEEILSYNERFALVHGNDRQLFILNKGHEQKPKGKGHKE